MGQSYALPLIDTMRSDQKMMDGKAKFLAKILTSICSHFLMRRFKQDVNEGLKRLTPAMQNFLKMNVGVMLVLSYDLKQYSDQLSIPNSLPWV